MKFSSSPPGPYTVIISRSWIKWRAFTGSLVIGFLLAACAKESQPLRSSSGQGVTASEALTEEEKSLAQDSSNVVLSQQSDLKPQSFNQLAWPLTCATDTAADAAFENPCQGRPTGSKVGIRSINITGLVMIVDLNEQPWVSLHGQRNISQLVLEADKIIVRGHLKLPGTHLIVRTDRLLFEGDGALDVTPSASVEMLPFRAGMKKGSDGADGLAGGELDIRANVIDLGAGDEKNKIRFIATGGRGQHAGDGFGQMPGGPPQYAGGRAVLAASFVPQSLKNVAGNVISSDGHNDGFVLDGRYPSRLLRKPPVGDTRWPEDGEPAIPGGAPGAGGPGGRVQISTGTFSELLAGAIDASHGLPGEIDPVRAGMKGGLPNPAIRIRWQGNVFQPTPVAESHTQKDGASAQGPTEPTHQNNAGDVAVRGLDDATVMRNYSDTYLRLKLGRIKDAYYNRQFDKTVALINELDGRIRTRESAATEKDEMALANAKTQLAVYTQNLVHQKDFFGRGRNDAPVFAFDFNSARYDMQVSEAMSAYYLARVFAADADNKHATVAQARLAMDAISNEIASAGEQIIAADGKLAQLGFELKSVEDNQVTFQQELDLLSERIRKDAEDRVRSRHDTDGLMKMIGVAASIARVIPAGQPMLAIGATLVSEAVKGPKTQDLGGWIEYASTLKADASGLGDNEKWQKSHKSWQDFFDKLDPARLRGLSLQEKGKYLSGLAKDLAPIGQEVMKGRAAMQQPAYPAGEIEVEIAKLEAADVMFQSVGARLRDLVARKSKLQKNMIEFSNQMATLVSRITYYVAVSSRVSETALDQVVVEDPELKSVFSHIAEDQEYRILYLYDELVRSYNYLSLRQVSHPLNIVSLRAKTDEILKQQTSIDEPMKTLRHFFDLQKNVVQDLLGDLLNDVSPFVVTHSGTRTLSIGTAKLEVLNNVGTVEIPLDAQFYQGRGNVRIEDIEVVDAGTAFVVDPKAKGSHEISAIALRFSLGESGDFNVSGAPKYFYPETGNLFKWEHSFEMRAGSWNSEPNPVTSDFRGLIGALITNSSVIEHSNIFSMHAGVTSLKLAITARKGAYKFKALKVLVRFRYSFACGDQTGFGAADASQCHN